MRVLILSLLFVTCVSTSALAKSYFITTEVTTKNGLVYLSGKSNLPNGTSLSISIVGVSSAFMAQGDATISNGVYKSEGYGPGNGIPDGNYNAELSAIKPEFKNAPLEKLLERGSNIEAIKKFTIKSGRLVNYNKKLTYDAKKATRSFSKKLSTMLFKGNAMEVLRNSPVQSDMGKCMQTMRVLQPITEKYRTEAESIPLLGPKIFLGSAATSLKLCVSCNASLASSSCKNAEASIREGIKQIDSE